MVTISNGFSKFHLAVAAAEANKRGILSQFVTGAYPTIPIQRLASDLRLSNNRKLVRLLDRGEDIPEPFVYPLWLSECVYQFGMMLRRFKSFETFGKWLNISSFKLYGLQAMKYIKQAPTQTKIYHYRAGFGGRSAKIAKERGMIALCDHSIAHPALLEYLIKNEGQLPARGTRGPMDHLWSNILQDIEQADEVLVNSDFAKETFLHQDWDPSRIHVIYWGVDDQFLNNIPPHFNRKRIDDIKVRMFASSLEPRKGVNSLIPALERIYDLHWHLEIAGSISPEIKNRYRNFLCNPRVTIAGTLRRHELAERMAAAEVFIFPSLAEGSARIVFEALACGCYVITTPNSGSIVEDGIHGALVPPGDVDALEVAIRQAIANRDRVAQIGQHNAQLIRSQYRQNDYGDALFQLYDKLLLKGKQKA